MTVEKTDIAVFVYNVGVLVSGAFVAAQFETVDRWLLFVGLFTLALFWTAYFRFSMLSRFDRAERTGES